VFLLCQVGPLSGREAKINDFTAIFAIYLQEYNGEIKKKNSIFVGAIE